MSEDLVKSEVWAIREVADIHLDPQIMDLKLKARCSPEDFESMLYELFPGSYKIDGDVAMMSIKGPLRGEDYNKIMGNLAELESDDAVAGVILDINSPGGSVAGCGETAQAVSEFSKPIVALASGMMCSAAYWIGSQADSVLASGSCSVGSVGVIATHASVKGAYDKMGIKITEVARGNKKNLFSPNKDLSSEGKKELQSQVDMFFSQFVETVSSKRDISEKVLDSGVFYGADAKEAGLIDSIVNTRLDMSVLFKNKEAPPTKAEGITSEELKSAVSESAKLVSENLNSEMSERLKPLETALASLAPIVEDYNKRAKEEAAKKEEEETIAKINESRKAKGLPLLVEEGDYEEKERDKKDKMDKEEKESKSKDDEISALNERIDALCKVIEKGGLGVHDPIAVDPDINNGLADKVRLKSSGRTIPIQRSWDWCYSKAADIRSWLQEQGTADEVKEFDSIVVPQIKQELEKAGVSKPRNIFSLLKGA